MRVLSSFRLEGLDREVARLPRQREQRRRRRDENFRAPGGDQIGDHGGEPSGAVILARQPDGDPHREEQPEIVEDRLPRRPHHRQIEQVRLSEPKQQGRDRQHRDRQHQRAADSLQLGK